MTKLINIAKNNDIKVAVDALKTGNLVVFPTETVYGIGANALDEKAVIKVFEAKGRPSDNPLIVHISSVEMLKKIVIEINKIQRQLMDAFWPGPLTIIFDKKEVIPDNVSGGLDTIGVRMPDNDITIKLISEADIPIVGPSANISGRPSGTSIDDIYDELNGKVDVIINNGRTKVGVESTVVKVDENKVIILRPGMITPNDIKKLGIEVELSNQVFNEISSNEKVLSPGTKYRHYAPKAESVLVYSKDNNQVIDKINYFINENVGKNIILLLTEENMVFFDNITKFSLGSKNDYMEISKNIFTLLRKSDNLEPDLIIIEGVEKKELGIAIMNRLIRACSNNYFEI